MSKPKTNKLLPVVGIVAVVIAVVVYSRWQTPFDVISETNRAIGDLENGDFRKTNMVDPRGLLEADRRFEEITKRFPGERLGWQNLAICRFLQLGERIDRKKREEAEGKVSTVQMSELSSEPVFAAIDDLLKFDDKSVVAHWLAGQTHLIEADLVDPAKRDEEIVAAIKRFQKAIEVGDDQAWVHYALFHVVDLYDMEEFADEGAVAIKRAFELAPDNLNVLLVCLVKQAETKDDTIEKGIEQAKQSLPFLAEHCQLSGIDDLEAEIASAEEAIQSDDWNTARVTFRGIHNVVKSHDAAKSDLSKMKAAAKQSALDFVVFKFSPEFYEKLSKSDPPPESEIDVSFKAVNEDSPFAKIADAEDLQVLDFDLDGLLDLVVLRKQKLQVFGRSKVDGDWKVLAEIEVPAGTKGITSGPTRDFEYVPNKFVPLKEARENPTSGMSGKWEGGPGCHIYDSDFVLFGSEGLIVVENVLDEKTRKRVLEVVPQSEVFRALKEIDVAQLADVDHDSDLDLVIGGASGVSVWINDGTLAFHDTSEFSTLPGADQRFHSMIVIDWDRDVDLDVLLFGKNETGFLENLRHGHFRWNSLDESLPKLSSSRAVVITELDGNISWDVVTAAKSIEIHQTKTARPGVVTDLSTIEAADKKCNSIEVWDYDNDAHMDLIATTDEGVVIFRNDGKDKFDEATSISPKIDGTVQICRTADLDNDGDLDLVVATDDGIQTFSNEGGNKNNFLTILGMGDEDNMGKGHHMGSLIEIRAGDHYQAQVINGQRVHFGLGSRESVDLVRMMWTNGMPQSVMSPDANQIICEEMTLKGSCPYLYTWDGEQFVFHTDLLWAAPIGLQTPAGTLAPSRPWENLRIPGERLKPKDGQYVLQITEELWEAAYFDRVELIAIDHPSGTDVFTNEKVGPPSIAEHKIHAVAERRYPVLALDKFGNDVMDRITQRDEDYFKGFRQRIRQGFVEDHFLELDLGNIDDPTKVKLFLTGWIMPTDTSINIGLSQNDDQSGPRFPFIEVPGKDGAWIEAVPFMGFPGGKPKTIVIELSKLIGDQPSWQDGDYRLRIATSAEIYWDEVFFTDGEQNAEIRTQKLELLSANVHDRGFSQRILRGDVTPERYLYKNVSRQPRWPPMSGNFTRYGDVRELLVEQDNRLLVIGSGDETTVAFQVPHENIPQGWQRDFVIRCVGWDKDADLNTVIGQTVEPLPFVGMSQYPYSPDERPDTKTYQDYLRTYQTRTQNAAHFWNRLRQPAAN